LDRIEDPEGEAVTEGRVLENSTVGTIEIGSFTVRRLGFGAMRIAAARNAEGVRDRAEARRLVQRVVDRGINFIDTANIYAYGASEEIIGEALRPYPDDVLISTKSGFRPGRIPPGETVLPALGRPEHIKDECDASLKRLGRDVIDLYQIHVPDPDVPYSETVGAFVELQLAGKIRHIGVSNVNAEQLAIARSMCTVVSVENHFSAGERDAADIVALCAQDGIAFIPWAPVIIQDTPIESVIDEIARKYGASSQQVSLAWLIATSQVMLPIPGTSKIQHLDQNVDAAWLTLDLEDVALLDAAAT
jgi:pyridoxine 4-dehydrogenase